MDVMPAEPAPRPNAGRSGGAPAWLRPARWRAALLAAASVLILGVLAWVAYQLAAARVPEHRAALEDLIRHETGLEVSFSELSLRWGWYGPEAVFRGVQLGEPGGAALLRAPRLIVSLDVWRMARTGQLEAGRIRLESPDIDLAAGGASGAPAPGRARTPVLSAAARILSRWRGGQIDIDGGTLHALAPGPALRDAVSIRHAQLYRLGSEWRADATVRLPESLGASAHLTLAMHGDPARPQLASGTLRFEGQRLAFAGWRVLAGGLDAARYLPQAGSGNVALRAQFGDGHVSEASGRFSAAGLEWPALWPSSGALALAGLSGEWTLTRGAGHWHFSAGALALTAAAQSPTPAAAPLSVTLEASADGAELRGRVRHMPLAAAAAVARWYAPELPLDAVALGGEARELTFDWSGRRPAGARLVTFADLEDLSVGNTAEGVLLSGLTGRVFGTDTRLVTDVEAPHAQLSLSREQPFTLDQLEVNARVTVGAGDDGGWKVSTDDLQIRRGAMGVTASAALGGDAAGAGPRIDAHLSMQDGDVALLAGLLGPRALAMPGTAAQLTAGRIESADLTWRGPLGGAPPWSAPGAQFTGAVSLREAHLAGPDLDLRGDTLLDVEVGIPALKRTRGPSARPRVRLAALLNGGQLQAVAGLPPINALRGTLGFVGGHLQHSTLTGQWLGGPVSLTLAERRERGATALTLSGRGTLDAGQALQAAGGNAARNELAGAAEWSALLTLLPGTGTQPSRWQLQADSNLIGVASRLPEPFAKTASAALPLHVELQAANEAGQLRVSLGDRLRALAALARSGDTWRIERGAVRLAATSPTLPDEAVMLLDGRLSRLDFPACLALWRQAGRDAALPALRAHLTAGQLLVGTGNYPQVSVTAQAMRGAGEVQLESDSLSGSVRWGSPGDGTLATVHLARFNLERSPEAAGAVALGAVLAPAVALEIDDLKWQGRALGSLAATLTSDADTLEVKDLRLSGPAAQALASARCQPSACRLSVSLDSRDAAAALAAFGLRADVAAREARLEAELSWSPQAAMPLATLAGHLHMQLEDGATTPAPGGEPFALLSVPALLAGRSAADQVAEEGLRFSRLSADYELHDGVASTSDLHFDGDAEILMRGRVGLVDGDYDEQAWVLRGEDRLPAAVRRLGPTPRVAAVWLSLREVLAGTGPARAPLRLRGTWSDPIVTPAE